MKWISDGVVLTCVRDRRAAVTAKQEKEKKNGARPLARHAARGLSG